MVDRQGRIPCLGRVLLRLAMVSFLLVVSHLYCTGEGGPTLVLDALFPGTVSTWVRVQAQIAKTARTGQPLRSEP